MSKSVKISDSSQTVTVGSRADRYWSENPYEPYYKELRPKLQLPKELQDGNNIEKIINKFGIKAVGFGNWVTVEDRINYVNAMIIAFYDLNKILKFNMNIGIHKHLSVSFGARGASSAIAHYEHNAEIINITRYKRGKSAKFIRFVTSGGIGSFAHEYGHFLDYFAGSYLDTSGLAGSLTNGRSVATKRVGVSSELRDIVDDIIEKIIWKKPNFSKSDYYIRLELFVEKTKNSGDYFLRRNEIFARAFEVFISNELNKNGIENKFLTRTKYNKHYYLKDSEMEKIAPLFRKLIYAIKNRIK